VRVLTIFVGQIFVIIFVITRPFAGAKKPLRTQIFEPRMAKRCEQKQAYYRRISQEIDKIRHKSKEVVMTKVTNSGVERCGSGHFALKSSQSKEKSLKSDGFEA